MTADNFGHWLFSVKLGPNEAKTVSWRMFDLINNYNLAAPHHRYSLCAIYAWSYSAGIMICSW